jgi:hypothetical protein
MVINNISVKFLIIYLKQCNNIDLNCYFIILLDIAKYIYI